MDILAELYPEASKLQKQLKYADAKGIPYVLLLGPEELAAGVAKVKTLATAAETTLALSELTSWLAA